MKSVNGGGNQDTLKESPRQQAHHVYRAGVMQGLGGEVYKLNDTIPY